MGMREVEGEGPASDELLQRAVAILSEARWLLGELLGKPYSPF